MEIEFCDKQIMKEVEKREKADQLVNDYLFGIADIEEERLVSSVSGNLSNRKEIKNITKLLHNARVKTVINNAGRGLEIVFITDDSKVFRLYYQSEQRDIEVLTILDEIKYESKGVRKI